jgi:hypothetical protein
MVLHSDVDPGKVPEDPVRAEAETEPETEDIPEDQEIDFVTLGMFIIGMSRHFGRVAFVGRGHGAVCCLRRALTQCLLCPFPITPSSSLMHHI